MLLAAKKKSFAFAPIILLTLLAGGGFISFLLFYLLLVLVSPLQVHSSILRICPLLSCCFFCNWASCSVILFLISTAAIPSGFSASTLWLVKTAALNLSTPHFSLISSGLILGICASSSRPAEAVDLQGSPCCISSCLRVCSLQLRCLQLEGDSASAVPAKEGGNLVAAKTANTKKERRTGQQCLELTLASVSGFVEVYPCFCEHNTPGEPRVSHLRWWPALPSKHSHHLSGGGHSSPKEGSLDLPWAAWHGLPPAHAPAPRTARDACEWARGGWLRWCSAGVSPGVLLGMLKSGQAALGRVSTHLEVLKVKLWGTPCTLVFHVLFAFHSYFWTPLTRHCLVQFKMSLRALLVY